MNILYGANDGYVKHLGTSLYSLLYKNMNEFDIDIYIMDMGISEVNKGKLMRLAKSFDREMHFISMGNLKEKFQFQIDTGSFDVSVLGRLFVGSFMPEKIDKILYLDCDTVILQSINHLYHYDLSGNIIGAVMEPTIYKTTKELLGLKDEDPYFNSGVLLIDLNAWRSNSVESKLLKQYQNLNGSSSFCDQDTINDTLKGKIKILPVKYNFFSNYKYFHYGTLVNMSPAYKKISKKSFKSAKHHPTIVHFAGDERPWYRGNFNPYRKAYEYYLSLTPWADSKKEKGKECYLFLYHMMNLCTLVCPVIRKIISDGFGLKMLRKRATNEKN